ncbi:hypothetical protein AMS68_004535 [Peltaster fructicola]|uniref:DNA/RNA-binding protein Kin17 WH-like domain-containing protein n=1 Tax=Peltaster fructicola TaxID=286661 RepID=A0A6H0XWP3_9PEZI|nr:hypothetical protein AMS68_004535 [Peltaster fructicola]
MPKAEVGSTKWVANKSKAKGLQRLRWYCQVCAKQCRDENGFKQHTLSEGHVRQMMLVGENPSKYINNYSSQFKRDFLQLLRTSHGEKKIHINHFYNEYIKDKEHVHMNATRWQSLTEFAKYLGRESICKVEEGERGLTIQWIDDSPEAVKRREDVKNKDRQAKGEEDLESKLLAQQIRKAKAQAAALAAAAEKVPTPPPATVEDAQPVKISFGLSMKPLSKPNPPPPDDNAPKEQSLDTYSTKDEPLSNEAQQDLPEQDLPAQQPAPAPVSAPVSSLSRPTKTTGSSALPSKAAPTKKVIHKRPEPEKKMSNVERIMREELERKRQRRLIVALEMATRERDMSDSSGHARYKTTLHVLGVGDNVMND